MSQSKDFFSGYAPDIIKVLDKERCDVFIRQTIIHYGWLDCIVDEFLFVFSLLQCIMHATFKHAVCSPQACSVHRLLRESSYIEPLSEKSHAVLALQLL